MSTISVAIRSVRVNDYLKQLLDSIQSQTQRPDEIVIIIPDDAGLRDEWDLLAKDVSVPTKVIRSQRGMISQRSAGISTSHGDLVLLLDDDLILPDRFVEIMASALHRTQAKCVVPFASDRYPQSCWQRFMLQIFSISVPYHGKGGNKQLLSGGFEYPLTPLSFGESAETETGSGAAILIDRKWVAEHHTEGDLSLQSKDNPYALREDAAFVYSQAITGGRPVIVNAGKYIHLGGTTRLDSRRLFWTYDASVRNNFIFWKFYIWNLQPTVLLRVRAGLGIVRHLIGITIFAVLSSVRHRSLSPIYGCIKGYSRLIAT